MSQIILSILTPAVPSRFSQLRLLWDKLSVQIKDKPVEHLVLLDNKRRTVGRKRDALLRAARGNYIAFVDDDDDVSDDYVDSILKEITSFPVPPLDVITFRQHSTVDGAEGEIEFRLGHPNDPFSPGKLVKRNAWHVCVWRRELALISHFPNISYGEDWAFAEPLCRIATHERHIPRVLHFYRHSGDATEAPKP